MRLTVKEVNDLSDKAFEHGMRVALALVVATVFAAMFVLLMRVVGKVPFGMAPTDALTGISFGGGMLALLALLLGWRKAQGYGARFVEWASKEIDYKFSLPDATPTAPAPAPEREIVVTNGDRAEVVPLTLLHGFEPNDLKWLCGYLAAGNEFTEKRLERIPLPSGIRLGKAEDGTPYQRLFGVPDGILLRAGIIADRGGPSHKAGTLIETDPLVMMTKLRALDHA